MNKSDSIKELATALNKAQAEMSGAKKEALNPFFKSKYANLEEVIACVKEPFADNGLSFMQFPITEDDRAGVETIVMHQSGEWISGSFMLKPTKLDPQGQGSSFSYAKRYALQSILGIPSEDDDGNHASKPAKKSNIDIAAVAKECGWTLQQVCESFDPPAKSVKDIQDLDACAAFLRSNKI